MLFNGATYFFAAFACSMTCWTFARNMSHFFPCLQGNFSLIVIKSCKRDLFDLHANNAGAVAEKLFVHNAFVMM